MSITRVPLDDAPPDTYLRTVSFRKWRMLDTDPLVSATATASASTPSGLTNITLGSCVIGNSGLDVQFTLSGGTSGETYPVDVVAVTTAGYHVTGYVSFYCLRP